MLGKSLQAAVAGQAAGGAYIEDVFSTYLYNGNGSTQTITNGVDLATEGGMVWCKRRDSVQDNNIWDTERNGYRIYSNKTDAQDTTSRLTYNTDGFTLTTASANSSGSTNVSWTFRKAPKFFDVVTYTGDGNTSQNISHNLGSVPGCIIVKFINAGAWTVYHRSTGATKYLTLNATTAATTATNRWNDTSPTDSVFTVGTQLNQSSEPYIAYLFAHDAGGFGDAGDQNVISCGSFTHNGTSTDINLGWEPQWFIIKRTDSTGYWELTDSMRSAGATGVFTYLYPGANFSESSNTRGNLLATGLNFNSGLSAGDYIYIAIRRGPMKTPTDATTVFTPIAGSSGAPTFKPGHVTDAVMALYRPGDAVYPQMWDRLRGAPYLQTSSTNAEVSDGRTWDYMNGAGNFSGDSNYHGECFRRAPGFFDVVCYTGTSSIRTVPHNLGVAPEMIIVKQRNGSTNWQVYHSGLDATNPQNYKIYLNLTNARAATSVTWNSTAPTSSVFTLGDFGESNDSGQPYVAYLFASCPGVSKVGSYTGNGTTQQIDCGFSNGARFVLVKRTSASGDWQVYDTARGIVSGNDGVLFLNSTDAENTSYDRIDPYSGGFEVNGNTGSPNGSGDTYIFLAIA